MDNPWEILNTIKAGDGPSTKIEKVKSNKPKKKPSASGGKQAAAPKPGLQPGKKKPVLTDKAAKAFLNANEAKVAPKKQPKKPKQQQDAATTSNSSAATSKPAPAAASKASSAASTSAGKPAPAAANGKQQAAASKGGKAAAAKDNAKEATPVVSNGASSSTPASTPAAQAVVIVPKRQTWDARISKFIKELDNALLSNTAFFKLSLNRGSEVELLQSNPYKVVGELVRSDKFLNAFAQFLSLKEPKSLRKLERVRIEKKINRFNFVYNLIVLLQSATQYERRNTLPDASEYVSEFLGGLWNIPLPAEKEKDKPEAFRREREDYSNDEDLLIGSAGNVRTENFSLGDFLTTASVKQGKGKKKSKPAPQATVTTEEKGKEKEGETEKKAEASSSSSGAVPTTATTEAAATAEGAPKAADPLAGPEQRPDVAEKARLLVKRVPNNMQCVAVEPTFFYSEQEIAASAASKKAAAAAAVDVVEKPFYFKGKGRDICYVFWQAGSSDVYCLLTNGTP